MPLAAGRIPGISRSVPGGRGRNSDFAHGYDRDTLYGVETPGVGGVE